jgi:hypothetical protein
LYAVRAAEETPGGSYIRQTMKTQRDFTTRHRLPATACSILAGFALTGAGVPIAG